MSRNRPIGYDPDPSPVDLQLRALENKGIDELAPSDLSTPEAVQLIIHSLRVSLTQLKDSQKEIQDLRIVNAELQQDREILRIEVAKLDAQVDTSWIEIPVSILSGFAINLITNDFKDGIGWVLLLISLAILLILRGKQLFLVVQQIGKQNLKGDKK